MLQIITATILGITPGCLGSFTVVSLYTHKMMGLPALVAVMIATSGDEAFVMFALFPGKAFLLHGVLFAIAILAGWLVQFFIREDIEPEQKGFFVHDQENCRCFSKKIIIPQLKRMTFERAVLLMFVVLFTILLLTGVIGKNVWDWKRITFMTGSLFMLFLFITVPEHFLKEHIYQHILRKHLLRIFLWTWGAFVVLHFIESSLALTNLVQNNNHLILILAVLMGVIPESGPHLVFVTMYSENLIPFSILLANSIVQDGHGMLPLLAESRKDFIKVKSINLIIGFIIGLLFMIFGL